MIYCDAHNHLHDERLASYRPAIVALLKEQAIRYAVVNGTRESDWSAVSQLCAQHPWAVPSFGLHPWRVAERSNHWMANLREYLALNPSAGVGEIGLDRWVEGHDVDLQRDIFLKQLSLAVELNRPVTIHCVRAWGLLDELLRAHPLPPRGFLLHAYAGPREMVDRFTERGAYFSFNAYFLHSRKERQRETFRSVPIERLLVETDAPDMAPPEETPWRFLQAPDGTILNHPCNLFATYQALAELREMSLERLAAHVAENFRRLFIG